MGLGGAGGLDAPMLPGVVASRFGLVATVASVALTACSQANTGAPAPVTDTATGASDAQVADVRAIETDLEGQIDQKIGVIGTRVTCPEQVTWQVGESFRCDVTAPDFPPGVGVVTLVDDSGRFSWYITNTCEGERSATASPGPECVTPPTPYDSQTCPWVDGHVDCEAVPDPAESFATVP